LSYKELFIGFTRSGLLGYGGGPSAIPLIRYEAVERFKWMNDDEFAEVLALGNALPGPIATKMAAYIGYKVKGKMGALIAILAQVVPTVLALIALLSTLYAMGESRMIKGMIAAVGPVIGMMLAVMGYQFLKKGWGGLGWKANIVMLVISFLALELLNIHPAIMIVVFISYAMIKTYFSTNKPDTKRSVS